MRRWYICIPYEGEILFVIGKTARTRMAALRKFSKHADPNQYYVYTHQEFCERRKCQ